VRGRARAPEASPQSAAPHPPIFSEENQAYAKAERPDLDAHRLWASFCDHYPVPKQTPVNWRKWVSREIRSSGNLPMTAALTEAAMADPDSKASVETLGQALGIGTWDALKEPWHAYKARVKCQATNANGAINEGSP
jgi:hypothetical protein